MVQHTPPNELLFDYAAGTLPEPLALLVASHLTLAPESRRAVHELEAVGGAMMEELEPAPLSESAMDAVLAKLDAEDDEGAGPAGNGATDAALPTPSPSPRPARAQPSRGAPATGASPMPEVLRRQLGVDDLGALNWKERGGSVAEHALLGDYPGFKTRLLRIKAGARVPSHTHGGREYTLVLKGGFSDVHGHYLPGDVSTADPDVTHQPVADDDEDCICLTVTDAPLKMTGPVGRFLNFFVDM
jgi:putative transcriptional regulator